MKRTYERPQQKVLCGSLLTVIALSGEEKWNWKPDEGSEEIPIIEGNPDTQGERVKSRGWDVFGE